MITGIRHDDITGRIDRQCTRSQQLAVPCTQSTKLQHKLTGIRKLLNAIVTLISNKDRSIRCSNYTGGEVKLTITVAGCSPLQNELSCSRKLLHSTVVCINNVHKARCISCDSGWKGKLTFTSPSVAPLRYKQPGTREL